VRKKWGGEKKVRVEAAKGGITGKKQGEKLRTVWSPGSREGGLLKICKTTSPVPKQVFKKADIVPRKNAIDLKRPLPSEGARHGRKKLPARKAGHLPVRGAWSE